MPRKIKVVDIPTVEETVFETAREEDAKEDDAPSEGGSVPPPRKEGGIKEDEIKDDYIDTKEEASKQDDLIPIPNSVNESTVIEEAKNDKPQKELVKCQYCNKNMLPKSLKYSHYQNCQGFKKINKITDKTPKPTEQPPEAPPPPPPPPIAIPKSKPKSKPRPKPLPQEEIVEESPTKTIDKPHPRTERMNLIKERYNNLVKNAFNI
jgi:hypothetical protein